MGDILGTLHNLPTVITNLHVYWYWRLRHRYLNGGVTRNIVHVIKHVSFPVYSPSTTVVTWKNLQLVTSIYTNEFNFLFWGEKTAKILFYKSVKVHTWIAIWLLVSFKVNKKPMRPEHLRGEATPWSHHLAMFSCHKYCESGDKDFSNDCVILC